MRVTLVGQLDFVFNQAFYYERAEGNPLYKDDKPPCEKQEAVDIPAYDSFLHVISKGEQAKPLKPEDNVYMLAQLAICLDSLA